MTRLAMIALLLFASCSESAFTPIRLFRWKKAGEQDGRRGDEFCLTQWRTAHTWIEQRGSRPFLNLMRSCAFTTTHADSSTIFAFTIRHPAGYMYAPENAACRIQIGPGPTEQPLDLEPILAMIEDERLRADIAAFLAPIDRTRMFYYEAVVSGVFVTTSRVPSSAGGVYELAIDGCEPPRRAHEMHIDGSNHVR